MKFHTLTPAALAISTALVGCGPSPDKIQSDFERKNALGIERYSMIVKGVTQGTHILLECKTSESIPKRRQLGDGEWRPARYLLLPENKKLGADTGDQVQRIDQYDSTNIRYRDWTRMISTFPKLSKSHWIADDTEAYPIPIDSIIPKDQLCKKVDPKDL